MPYGMEGRPIHRESIDGVVENCSVSNMSAPNPNPASADLQKLLLKECSP